MRSSLTMSFGVVLSKVCGFGSKVILTRLLLPQEIGLVVMIVVLTGLFEVLAEVGVKQSVIRNPRGAEPAYLNTAWWFHAIRSVGLFLLAYITAPWLCSFYFKDKADVIESHTMYELIMMSRVAFLTIFFNGLVSPRAHVLEKYFKFGKVVIINQASFMAGVIITIILAFIYRSVWAMVLGLVIAALAKCVFSYILCPFLPRLVYDGESFKEILGFAKGIFGLPILTHAIYNMDVFVIGKVFPASIVGMYGMALILAKTPWDLFGKVFLPLLLPVFSELQEDAQRLRKVVLKAVWTSIGASLPICIAVIFFRKQILTLTFGSAYTAVGTAFGLLCIYVVCLIISTILASVLFGIGQPGKHRLGMIIWAVIGTALIYPFISLFGFAGAPISLIVAAICSLLVEWRIINGCLSTGQSKYEEKNEFGGVCAEKA